jgi:DNA-directed RNA polymerase subunit beta
MFRLNLSRFFQLETKSDERGNEGLYNTFMENFPITDTRNNFVLEFLDLWIHHVIQFKNV